MRLYSTRNPSHVVSLRDAVMKGIPPDKGLYMPEELPRFTIDQLRSFLEMSLPELGFEVSKALFKGEIPEGSLKELISSALNFPAPVVQVSADEFILELFHGPTLAFKDFGARYMAQLMGYFNRSEDKELVILVATSGDTGGAVASGFYGIEGIRVVILYPSEKVSSLQEKQLTTWGGNILAVEVKGTFDDCQHMVKSAFVDRDLVNRIRMSSANSINIARLIPQSFYYFEAWKQVHFYSRPIVFVVPSGNFGNLTAGVLAKKMGLPVKRFIAATNINDVVPEYLRTGRFNPRPSVQTISNAMDVGNPSNFERLIELYGSTWNKIKQEIRGYAFDDGATLNAIREMYEESGYLLDPHGAVGHLAWKSYSREERGYELGVVLETAHPAKFIDVVSLAVNEEIPIPSPLAELLNKEKKSFELEADYERFKEWLIESFG